MARAHIKTNQAARNFRFQVKLTATAPTVSPAVPRVDFTAQLTTMTGNVYPDSGFRQTIYNVDNNPEPDYISTVTMEYPGLSWYPTVNSSTAWRTPLTSRVEVDSAVLTESCDPWSFDCGDIRWYVDGVLQDTKAGPNSHGGTGFDHRYNTSRLEAIASISGAVNLPRMPDCGDTTKLYTVSGNANGGWQDYDGGWVSQTTILESTWALPTPIPNRACDDCDCQVAITSVSGSTSYDMTATAEATHTNSVTTVGVFECICWDGSPGGTLTLKLATVEHTSKYSSIDIFSKDDGVLFGHTKSAEACCGCLVQFNGQNCDDNYTETVEPFIYCGSVQTAYHFKATRNCYEGGTICPVPPSSEERQNCNDEPPSKICVYQATREIGHTPYSCTACVGDCHLTSNKVGLYYASIVESGGNLCVWRFDLFQESYYTPSPVDTSVSNAQIAWHPNGTVLVVYQKSGQVYWKASTDMGETWTARAQIGTGFSKPAIAVDQKTGNQYVAAWSGSAWRLWTRKGAPSGSWTNTASITTTNADRVTMEMTSWGDHTLAFCHNTAGGVVSVRYSTDLGETWTAAETVVASLGTDAAIASDTKSGYLAIALHNGTAWRYYKKKNSADTWTDTGVLSTAPTKHAGFEFGYESPHKAVLVVENSAVMKRYMTTDLGATAAEA